MKRNYSTVPGAKPTVFKDAAVVHSSPFDVAPFLEILQFEGADGIAKAIDEMIHELTAYYLDHDGNHAESRNNLFYLKCLRDAFLKGAGIVEFRN